MKRLLLILGSTALLAGCVVATRPYVPPPEPVYVPPAEYVPPPQPVVEAPPPEPQPIYYSYFGQHLVPEEMGGGWCYIDGPHTHDYAPDPALYVMDGNFWYYSGPAQFTYYSGHPLPGGGWCPISGPHYHEYFPPRGVEWRYRRGVGYVYEGPYRADRPPPRSYWVRPAPLPARAVPQREWERRQRERPAPPRVEPRPEPRPEPGRGERRFEPRPGVPAEERRPPERIEDRERERRPPPRVEERDRERRPGSRVEERGPTPPNVERGEPRRGTAAPPKPEPSRAAPAKPEPPRAAPPAKEGKKKDDDKKKDKDR